MQEGTSNLVFGHTDEFSAVLRVPSMGRQTGYQFQAIDSFDHSGFATSGASDVHGSGFDDVIFGASLAEIGDDDTREGEAYVVSGGDFQRNGRMQVGGSDDDIITADLAEQPDILVGGLGDDTLMGGTGTNDSDTAKMGGGVGGSEARNAPATAAAPVTTQLAATTAHDDDDLFAPAEDDSQQAVTVPNNDDDPLPADHHFADRPDWLSIL